MPGQIAFPKSTSKPVFFKNEPTETTSLLGVDNFEFKEFQPLYTNNIPEMVDTKSNKEKLLEELIQANLSDKDKISEKCIQDLKAISAIVDAKGNIQTASDSLKEIYTDDLGYKHINRLLRLFTNRNGKILEQNITKNAARYTYILEKIIKLLPENLENENPQEILEIHMKENIQKVLNEANKWYRSNYIKDVKVNINNQQLRIEVESNILANIYIDSLSSSKDLNPTQIATVFKPQNIYNKKSSIDIIRDILSGFNNKSPYEIAKFCTLELKAVAIIFNPKNPSQPDKESKIKFLFSNSEEADNLLNRFKSFGLLKKKQINYTTIKYLYILLLMSRGIFIFHPKQTIIYGITEDESNLKLTSDEEKLIITNIKKIEGVDIQAGSNANNIKIQLGYTYWTRDEIPDIDFTVRFDITNNGYDLRDINLTRLENNGPRINNFNYRNLNLSSANFQGNTLIYCNFEGLNLECANFSNANLNNSTMEKSKLFAAILNNAKLINVNFEKVNLKSAQMKNVDIRGANFKDAIFNYEEDIAFTLNLCMDEINKDENYIIGILKAINTIDDRYKDLKISLIHQVINWLEENDIKIENKSKIIYDVLMKNQYYVADEKIKNFMYNEILPDIITNYLIEPAKLYGLGWYTNYQNSHQLSNIEINLILQYINYGKYNKSEFMLVESNSFFVQLIFLAINTNDEEIISLAKELYNEYLNLDKVKLYTEDKSFEDLGTSSRGSNTLSGNYLFINEDHAILIPHDLLVFLYSSQDKSSESIWKNAYYSISTNESKVNFELFPENKESFPEIIKEKFPFIKLF